MYNNTQEEGKSGGRSTEGEEAAQDVVFNDKREREFNGEDAAKDRYAGGESIILMADADNRAVFCEHRILQRA
jgi:hypothetical protein